MNEDVKREAIYEYLQEGDIYLLWIEDNAILYVTVKDGEAVIKRAGIPK